MASFKQLLTYYGFTKEEREHYRKQLYAVDSPFSHFHLNVPKMTFELESPEFTPLTQGEGNNRKKSMELFNGRQMSKKDALAHANAYRFLGEKLIKNSAKAIALFEIIYSQLPKRQIDAKTLTIQLRKKKGFTGEKGSHVRVNLIDYLSALTDPLRQPTPLIAQFHAYIIRYHCVILPAVYVVNKRFV